MKTRMGFVSNSSSSSFLVCIVAKTFEEFCEEGLFNYNDIDLDSPVHEWEIFSEEPKTYRECLKKLWDDVHHHGKKIRDPEKEWKHELTQGWLLSNSFPSHRNNFIDGNCIPHNCSNEWENRKEAERVKKEMEKAADVWNKYVGIALAREMKERFPDGIYQIRYSDNDGEALMEHGYFWNIVPHVRLSNH